MVVIAVWLERKLGGNGGRGNWNSKIVKVFVYQAKNCRLCNSGKKHQKLLWVSFDFRKVNTREQGVTLRKEISTNNFNEHFQQNNDGDSIITSTFFQKMSFIEVKCFA